MSVVLVVLVVHLSGHTTDPTELNQPLGDVMTIVNRHANQHAVQAYRAGARSHQAIC